jgi:hypothetical protein
MIKKEGLLLKWYGVSGIQSAQNSMEVNIYTDDDEFEYKKEPPFKADVWLFKKNMAIKKKPWRLWTKPSTKNILLVLFFLILLDIIIESFLGYFLPDYFEGFDSLFARMFSISHITGFLIFIIILFNEKYIRSYYIIFFPFLFIMIWTIIFVYIPSPDYNNQIIIGTIVGHIPHFIMTAYLIIKEKWTDWQYLIHASILYFFYFMLLWLVIPDYRMVAYFGFSETLLLHTIGSWITILVTFIAERFHKHHKSMKKPKTLK